MAAATRMKTVCPVFDAPEELPRNVLPTYLDVMKNEVTKNLTSTNKNYPSFIDVAEGVIHEVEKLWKKVFVFTISHNHVVQLLQRGNATCRMLF